LRQKPTYRWQKVYQIRSFPDLKNKLKFIYLLSVKSKIPKDEYSYILLICDSKIYCSAVEFIMFDLRASLKTPCTLLFRRRVTGWGHKGRVFRDALNKKPSIFEGLLNPYKGKSFLFSEVTGIRKIIFQIGLYWIHALLYSDGFFLNLVLKIVAKCSRLLKPEEKQISVIGLEVLLNKTSAWFNLINSRYW